MNIKNGSITSIKFLGNYDTKNPWETKNESSVFKIETFPPSFTCYFRFVTRNTSNWKDLEKQL